MTSTIQNGEGEAMGRPVGFITPPSLAREPATADVERVAAQPFIAEINRLEREYGFDRPMHQGQCLMLPLSDLIAFRAAFTEAVTQSSTPTPEWISGDAGRAEAIKHGADSYGDDDLTEGAAA